MSDSVDERAAPADPSSVLACTVRDCGGALERAERALVCPLGHRFDVARRGYVNLLQPNDRRSLDAGDSLAAVRARAALEQRGIGDALRLAIVERAAPRLAHGGGRALDVGCGTGALLGALAARVRIEAHGVDLSAHAAAHAARAHPGCTFAVANADRRLPYVEGCFDVALCALGPKHPEELARVLRPRGLLVLAVPAPDDLIELRAALAGRGLLVERADAALARFEPAFELVERARASERVELDRAALGDLLAASYRGARARERERADALAGLAVTLAADVLCLERRT